MNGGGAKAEQKREIKRKWGVEEKGGTEVKRRGKGKKEDSKP